MCAACRARLNDTARVLRSRPRCFQCYRAEFERQRTLQAAGQLDTASEERFQEALPFSAVNRARLDRLKAERATARQLQQAGVGRFADRRRQAQIAARHALQRIIAGLDARQRMPAERARVAAAAIHAAELQLPDAWLPFVVSR